MASSALGSGRTPRGTSSIFRMGTLLREIVVSPTTFFPFVSVAARCTLERVEGKIRPRVARTLLDSRTASAKSPVTCVNAVRNRLPKLCPRNPRPDEKRNWKSRPISASSLDKATIQFRISPGGNMRFSRRKRPELPPSSVTVTMATKSVIGRSAVACRSERRTTWFFNPRSNAERPVPPPKATTRNPCAGVRFLSFIFFTYFSVRMLCAGSLSDRSMLFSRARFRRSGSSGLGRRRITRTGYNGKGWSETRQVEIGGYTRIPCERLARVAFLLWIQQFRESRIFLKESEIFVISGVISIRWTQIDGNFQISHGRIRLAGKTIEGGQRIVDMIQLRRQLPGLLEAFARFIPAAQVHHRYAL